MLSKPTDNLPNKKPAVYTLLWSQIHQALSSAGSLLKHPDLDFLEPDFNPEKPEDEKKIIATL